jgi:hypothetical protein
MTKNREKWKLHVLLLLEASLPLPPLAFMKGRLL